MVLTTIEGQIGDPFFRVWKAISSGYCRKLDVVPCRDARAVVPSVPSSSRMCAQDRSAVPQKSSHIIGMLSPISSTGSWSSALGKEVGRPRIFLELFL